MRWRKARAWFAAVKHMNAAVTSSSRPFWWTFRLTPKCRKKRRLALAPLFRFKDEADVIAQANDTEFGLAAHFYARDLSRVFRVGEALEYGIIGINTGIISNEVAPFGGIKASGLGREGSKYGIEDYLEIKYMCIGL